MKFKFLPHAYTSRKVNMQIDKDPTKKVHADEASPSAIINGFSDRPHVSHIQRIWFNHMLIQSQFTWLW